MTSLVNTSGSSSTSEPPPLDIVLRIDAATKIINSTVPMFVVIAGCISNILVIVGVRSKSFRSIQTSYYMLCLAINDTTSVLCLLIPHWLNAAFPNAIHRGQRVDILCKFLQFYGWGQMDVAILLTALMSYDRAKAMEKPLAQHSLSRTRATILLAVLFCAAKNFHFWLAADVSSSLDRLCTVRYISPTYKTFWTFVWPWLHFAFQTACFLWIGVCNSHVVRLFREARRKSSWNHQELSRQVTRMLLAESIVFTLLTLPLCLHTFVQSQLEGMGKMDLVNHTTPLTVSLSGLLFTIAFNMLYSNKCVTFAVYCIFSKTFRDTVSQQTLAFLQRLVTCHFRLQRRSSSLPGALKLENEVQGRSGDISRDETYDKEDSTPGCSNDVEDSTPGCSNDVVAVSSCTLTAGRTAVMTEDVPAVDDPTPDVTFVSGAAVGITAMDDTDLEKKTLDAAVAKIATANDTAVGFTALNNTTLDDAFAGFTALVGTAVRDTALDNTAVNYTPLGCTAETVAAVGDRVLDRTDIDVTTVNSIPLDAARGRQTAEEEEVNKTQRREEEINKK